MGVPKGRTGEHSPRRCSLGPPPQAKTSGKFSREELDKLWRELQHHREKVREYNVLLETLSRTEGAMPPVPSGRPPGCRMLQKGAVGEGSRALSGPCPAL